MEPAKEFDLDMYNVTPLTLHSIGHSLYRNGEISFTQYSLLSIPCEQHAATQSRNQPFDAINYYKEMNTQDMAEGVPDQLDSLIRLLDKMSVKTA